MKYLKNLSLVAIAVIVSQSVMAQRGRTTITTGSTITTKVKTEKLPKVDRVNKRETARVDGSLNTNASVNANDRAKQRANENSAINNGVAIDRTKRTKAEKMEDKRLKREQKRNS